MWSRLSNIDDPINLHAARYTLVAPAYSLDCEFHGVSWRLLGASVPPGCYAGMARKAACKGALAFIADRSGNIADRLTGTFQKLHCPPDLARLGILQWR